MGRAKRESPADLAPEPWPTKKSQDPVGEVARQFAINLRTAIGASSLRAAADACELDHSTLSQIMAGRSWPDLETIAKIERGLAADVWPGRG